MEIENIPISEIKPYEKNPRKNDKAVDIVAKSIKEFGFKVPIILDKNNQIIAGHTRLKAAIKLNLKEVPVIRADELNEEQVKAFRIMDNKSADYSEWDFDLLKDEFLELDETEYDLENTGFDLRDIGDILDDMETKDDGFVEVDAYERAKNKTKIKQGDIYQLGEHRLMCGDSTIKEDVDRLMDQNKADMVFTDPPYGVDYSGKNEFLNKIDEGKRIQERIKEDDIKDMGEFLDKVCDRIKENMKETNAIYFTFAGSTLRYLLNSLEETGFKMHQILVWFKNNHVLGRVDYAYKHELIVYGWYGKHKYYGEFCPSVWEIDKPHKSELHPTMKPIELCAKAIGNSSQVDMVVLDLFGGSGSTLIACEQLNRKCFMMEIDYVYCQVIIDRWEKLTKSKAVKL